MRTSLPPTAGAIQPWAGGGERALKPPRPRRIVPSIMAKQPTSASSLLDSSGAAGHSPEGEWPGDSVRRAGAARSQQATAGSGQGPWSRLSATSTQLLAASTTTVASCRRTRAVQHRAETQVGRQATIPTRGAVGGKGVAEGVQGRRTIRMSEFRRVAPAPHRRSRASAPTAFSGASAAPSPTCACTECRSRLGRARVVVDEDHRGGPPRTVGATGDHAQAPHGQRQPTGSRRERPRTTGAKPLPGAPCTGRRHGPVAAMEGAAANSRDMPRVGYSPPLTRR